MVEPNFKENVVSFELQALVKTMPIQPLDLILDCGIFAPAAISLHRFSRWVVSGTPTGSWAGVSRTDRNNEISIELMYVLEVIS